MKNMRNKKLDELINKLKAVFIKYPTVLTAYLYGSYVRGYVSPLSDVDIGVILIDKTIYANLLADIANELKIPEEKISLIDITDVDPLLRLKILSEGVEIINRGVNLSSLINQTVEIYELEQTSSSRSWLRGDPIDLLTIRDIISKIFEDANDLHEILEFGYDRVISDKHLKKSFERTMQTLVESMIDVLRHIVSGLNLGIPAYYKDYIEFAKQGNVISEKTELYLKRLIPI